MAGNEVEMSMNISQFDRFEDFEERMITPATVSDLGVLE